MEYVEIPERSPKGNISLNGREERINDLKPH
jgi:hypothetical protein